MSIEAIIVVTGGLVFGLAGAFYARWSRARLERTDPDRHRQPAE